MKVSLLSLGCRVNQAECSQMEATLRERGWSIVNLDEGPDYSIINTCSVTAKSDYQSRQLIRRASGCGSRVVVTGCYSELNKDLVKSMDGVEIVVNNCDKESIVNKLSGDALCSSLDFSVLKRSRFHLKIQDGCNNSCSYCIIPAARGRSRSLTVEEIVRRVRMLSACYSEVVLSGIHLGTYGYDLLPKVKLSYLLSEILSGTGIKRVRLSSLEIGEIDDELLEIMQDRRVCNHLHIPLQSGDDKILRGMNRRYDSARFSTGIRHIYSRLSNISIGSDVIAGFPGEGEVEFENTRNLIESLPLSYLHVSPFSPRPGTKASNMQSQVDSQTKKDRGLTLRRLSDRKKKAYMMDQVGRCLDLLIEDVGADGQVIGTTGNYLKVRAVCHSGAAKNLVGVRITKVRDDLLLAHVI